MSNTIIRHPDRSEGFGLQGRSTSAFVRQLLGRTARDRAIILCGILSIAAFAATRVVGTRSQTGDGRIMLEAARIMERAMEVIRHHSASEGLILGGAVDPNHTGLIGPEYTAITTSVGDLEAKRTTTNPNVTGLLVRLLQEAGVVEGDSIAVGSSGSFPALMIATLAAARAMNVHPVMILSLGSSSYGATRPDFTLLDIYRVLQDEGVIDVSPAAISLGGAHDVGSDYDPEVRRQLVKKILASEIPFLEEPDLARNVEERMAVYFGSAKNGKIAAFVNIGGSYADLGTNPLVLKLEPGVNRNVAIPATRETYGVVFAMAEKHIPIVHLLHIKGLALKYGLPWDPVPLPRADAEALLGQSPDSSTVQVIAVSYFAILAVIFFLHRDAFFKTS